MMMLFCCNHCDADHDVTFCDDNDAAGHRLIETLIKKVMFIEYVNL
jgi:hypothetical protein